MFKFFVIGGPISSGKSTLAKSLPFKYELEIDENDLLLKEILKATYLKDRIAPEVIEYYFLQLRKSKYKQAATDKEVVVLDRAIFESVLFAEKNLEPDSFLLFEKLWKDEIEILIKKYGKPILYILLDIDWDNFKKHLFKRKNSYEINNFEKNKEFFKKHIKEYKSKMIKIFEQFNIQYFIINVNNKSIKQIKEIALKQINNRLNQSNNNE